MNAEEGLDTDDVIWILRVGTRVSPRLMAPYFPLKKEVGLQFRVGFREL